MRRANARRKIFTMANRILVTNETGDIRRVKQVKAVDKFYTRMGAGSDRAFRVATRTLVDRANRRLSELRKAGISNTATEIIKGAFGTDKIKLDIKKMSIEQIEQINRITTLFLNNNYSVVSNARLQEEAKFEGFRRILKETGNNVANIQALYRFMGDIDFPYLLSLGYSSEQIIDEAVRIMNAGIDPTTDALETALSRGIKYYLEVYLTDEGLDVDELNALGFNKSMSDYVDIAEQFGYKDALAQYEEDKRTAELMAKFKE